MTIGFIGQGWIGKNYADNFESRGFRVVRYALEKPYFKNRAGIKSCDIVFIAVPTPTTPRGFDASIIDKVISLVGKGKIAVIKSTVTPGVTEKIQKEHSNITVLHSPEFLVESTARYDTDNPTRNIIGIPYKSSKHKSAAKKVLRVLPKAPIEITCLSKESEFIKYAANGLLYAKVVFANLLYDLAESLDCDWRVVKQGVTADPRVGKTHLDPIHKSRPGVRPGRGAGGHCFIKDFAALKKIYGNVVGEKIGLRVIEALERKNNNLLLSSNKDVELLRGVYGKKVPH